MHTYTAILCRLNVLLYPQLSASSHSPSVYIARFPVRERERVKQEFVCGNEREVKLKVVEEEQLCFCYSTALLAILPACVSEKRTVGYF